MSLAFSRTVRCLGALSTALHEISKPFLVGDSGLVWRVRVADVRRRTTEPVDQRSRAPGVLGQRSELELDLFVTAEPPA